MEIEQKSPLGKFRFTFLDHELRVWQEDADAAGEFGVPYERIPFEFTVVQERNRYLRNIGIGFTILGGISALMYGFILVLATMVDRVPDVKLGTSLVFLPAGLLFLYLYRRNRVTYTIFDAEPANILVMQNKHHEEVIEQITSRRNARLLELYGNIDAESTAEDEKHRIDWLLQKGVISQELYDEKLAEIDAVFGDSTEQSPPSVH